MLIFAEFLFPWPLWLWVINEYQSNTNVGGRDFVNSMSKMKVKEDACGKVRLSSVVLGVSWLIWITVSKTTDKNRISLLTALLAILNCLFKFRQRFCKLLPQEPHETHCLLAFLVTAQLQSFHSRVQAIHYLLKQAANPQVVAHRFLV